MSAATLIIPVENQVRELDAKLLLSAAAAERGYPVVIGSRAFVHYAASHLPRGVYLAKSMRTLSDRMFGILRNLGHDIIGFDEEGLVRLPDDEYYRRRLSAKALTMVSHLLAWGRDDARVFRAFSGMPDIPIHITGNPRVDMMRPELRGYLDREVDAIRSKRGRFVLINSNFSEVNHFLPGMSETLQFANETDYMKSRVRYRVEIYRDFQQMLPAITRKFPEIHFVLRPHPSENHEAWRKLGAGSPNLEVINEGSVAPWMLAASAVISNGCTTAIEARILDRATISYKVHEDASFDHPIADDVAHSARSLEELEALLSKAAKDELGPRDDEQSRTRLKDCISARDGALSVDRIVDLLDEAGHGQAPPPAVSASTFAAGWAQNQFRTAQKRINMRREGHRNHWSYHTHRFPEVSAEDLQARIDRMGKALGRFDGIRIEAMGPYLFRMFG
jgi:surface carbohydrate biosynthesis protein